MFFGLILRKIVFLVLCNKMYVLPTAQGKFFALPWKKVCGCP